MADVFLAAAQGPAGSGFTKLAVLKKLRANLAEDPAFVAMLMDEARITARLAHPNVVQLFEVGQDDDTYFLAIEYLDGQPLHRVDRRAKRERADFPPELYYAIVSDVLAGLHHAHELTDYDGTPLEIVHRDVTPHNVFVTYDGAVKVVDFGIAKAMGRATETKQGIVKGKVRYMSPEQASGGELDRRTDIFAAGIILWNAATGTKLWSDLDEFGIVRALCSGTYDASPRDVCPAVPEEIDSICRKALAFRPEDRYATAAEMREELEKFLGRGSTAARNKLESTMKTLFAAERVKLRVILENAGLTSVASIDAFTAAAAAQATDEPAPLRDSEPPGPGHHTVLMPGAPAHPAPPPAKRQAHEVRAKRELRAAREARSRPNVAFAGKAVGVVAVGALIAFGAGSLATTGPDASDARGGATVATGITPRVLTASHGKATAAQVEPAPAAQRVDGGVGAKHPPSVARRTAGGATQSVDLPAPSPSAQRQEPAAVKAATGDKLDVSDPWGGVKDLRK